MKRNPMHEAGPVDEDLKSHADVQDEQSKTPHPDEPRKIRHPGKDEPADDRPESEDELADQAERRYRSSSADKGLEQGDRGMEGGKQLRNHEDHVGSADDRVPPVRSPQDDLA